MRLEAVGKRYGVRQPWIVRNVSQEVVAGQLIRLEGRFLGGLVLARRAPGGLTQTPPDDSPPGP